MKWENLSTFECPYCDRKLFQKSEEIIHCKVCVFEIDVLKFKSILSHRLIKPINPIQYKWQNLKNHRCPICSQFLREEENGLGYYKCTSGQCTFCIQEARIQEILSDKNHPANRYYEKDSQFDSPPFI